MNLKNAEESYFICTLLKPVDLFWTKLKNKDEIYHDRPSLCFLTPRKNKKELFNNRSKNFKIRFLENKKIIAKWKKEETDLLIKLSRSKISRQWKKIAEIIGTKTKYQCLYKYNKLKKRNKLNFQMNDEDFLTSSIKVENYFSKKKKLNFNSLSEIKTNQNFDDLILESNEQRIIKKDEKHQLELNSRREINPDIDSNAIQNYNKKFLNMKSLRSVKETQSYLFDEGMRKNSPDELLPNLVGHQGSIDSLEFKKVFEMNFSDGSTNDKDEFYNINESEFKMTNLICQKESDFRERSESTIKKIEIFINSKDFLVPQACEIEGLIKKMTYFLKEIHTITTGYQPLREHLIKALELQTIILSNLIRFTQQKMSTICE